VVRLTSVRLARQAPRGGPDDPHVLAWAASVCGYFGEDIGVAIGLIDPRLVSTRDMLALGTRAGYSESLPVSQNAHSMISRII
jgi:hypothetical protein